MRRRALLASIAAGVVGSPGCLSGDPETTSRPPGQRSLSEVAPLPTETAPSEPQDRTPVAVRTGPSHAPDIGVPTGVESNRDSPAETFVFGRASARSSGIEPRHVVVWNTKPEAADVSLTATDSRGDRPLVDRPISLAPDAYAHLHLVEPAPYRISVAVGDTTESLTRDRADFDCNTYATRVMVTRSGIETRTVSTLVACSSTLSDSP